jgi:hypothetical protein
MARHVKRSCLLADSTAWGAQIRTQLTTEAAELVFSSHKRAPRDGVGDASQRLIRSKRGTRGKPSPAIEGDETAEARMRLESHYVQLH